jgi:hypothetical protein
MVQRENDRWGWLHAGTALLLACLVPMQDVVTLAADTATADVLPASDAPFSASISFVESASEQSLGGSADDGEPQTLQVTAVGLHDCPAMRHCGDHRHLGQPSGKLPNGLAKHRAGFSGARVGQ